MIPTGDEELLAATRFKGDDERGMLLIASAMGISQRFYFRVATYFAQRGYTVYTFDYSGIGQSKVIDPSRCTLLNWGQRDLSTMIAYMRTHHPGYPLRLLGHSVAGQIFPFAFNNHLVESVCMVTSSNLSSRFWKGRDRLIIYLFWYVVVPLFNALFNGLPGFAYGGKEKIPYLVARDWATSGKHRFGFMGIIPEGSTKYAQTTSRFRFISFEDDTLFAPRTGAYELFRSYGSEEKEHIHYIPGDWGKSSIGHFGFFRKGMEPLWEDVAGWYAHK